MKQMACLLLLIFLIFLMGCATQEICRSYHTDKLVELYKEGTITELQLFDAIHGKPNIPKSNQVH